jgi:hypothetical protein
MEQKEKITSFIQEEFTEQTITRFSNEKCVPKLEQQEVNDLKQSCVGDYSCCGHVP